MASSKDRISCLPDEVLCHILSYVPTKHAVTTSILSKRWTHLWLSVPLLDFSDIKLGNPESIVRFNEFVYSIMFSREAAGNHSIKSFYLDIEYTDFVDSLSLSNLTEWVNLAVQRKVKHLSLHLNLLNDRIDVALRKSPTPKLPNSIFSCKTLVVLNLTWLSLNGFSFSSVGFGFPSLKTLHLNHVTFDGDRGFLLLLAGCPVLEDFKAFDLFTSEDVTEESISQVFHSLCLSKLIRADIIGVYCNFPMKALINSEFLRIQLWQMYAPYDLPTFSNLTHLVINCYSDIFIKVLYHCPNLQNLELYQKTQTNWDGFIEGEKGRESWVDPRIAPQCLSLYLRTCIIWDFTFANLQRNIVVARYILKNARVLQTMTIWRDKKQPELESELIFSCPRASQHVNFQFIDDI